MSDTTPDVDQVLKTPFPSFHQPLELARSLNRAHEPAGRAKALELLDGLRARYPHVLAVGQEFVLALIENNQHDRAETELKRLENTFAILDEESLCRWGRIFKDRGDAYVDLFHSGGETIATNRDRARDLYAKSLEKYDKAYAIREGHYPGINKATLLLLIGSLKSAPSPGAAPGSVPQARELIESTEVATKLLAGRSGWKANHRDDETIWHPATEAEAHLLRQDWAQAAALYREVLGGRSINHHARESMRRQAERVLLAFRQVGVVVPPPWDDLAAFFAVPPVADGHAKPPSPADSR